MLLVLSFEDTQGFSQLPQSGEQDHRLYEKEGGKNLEFYMKYGQFWPKISKNGGQLPPPAPW